MSLRATGEGHISSIVFRSGSIDAATVMFTSTRPSLQQDAQSGSAGPIQQVDIST